MGLTEDKRKKKDFVFFSGIIFLAGLFLLYLILGQDILVLYHDQLDSEVLYYMLKGKNLSSVFQETFPEFMHGEAVVEVAAPFQLLYYLIFSPVTAFILNLYVVRITAYVGMYLLLRRLSVERILCLMTGLMFSILPFYSVYGLSAMGIPMVTVCFLNLWKQEHRLLSGCCIAWYGVYSSIVLTGFVLLGILAVWLIILCIKGKKEKRSVALGTLILFITYCISSFSLIRNLIAGSEGFVSHRTEMVSEPTGFIESFTDLLFHGQYQAVSLHRDFWILVPVFLLLVIPWRKKEESATLRRNRRIVLGLMGLAVAIALFHALFLSEAGIRLRTGLFGNSMLQSFQFNRVFWLYPTIWYLMLALMLSYIMNRIPELVRRPDSAEASLTGKDDAGDMKRNRLWKRLTTGMGVLLLVVVCAEGISQSDAFQNIFNRKDHYSGYVRWRQFFAEDTFEEIKACTGEDVETYSVVSVGLFPSIALYNGFYCLDGYSQNYNLDYKHFFYDVMKDEIGGESERYDYFQNWGNRCYLLTSSSPFEYIPKKKEPEKLTVRFDFQKLKSLGCRFIISRYELENASELGIGYEGYFDMPDGLYGVHLYRIGQED